MFLLPNEYWEVRETEKKGRGVFAKKDISAGAIIGDYLGKLVLDKDFDELTQGLYTMYFNNETSIAPDPETLGIHLINHSCSANCEMFPYKGHMLYFANRFIFAGEELTVRYLLDPPEKGHVCTHICYCGSLVCHGTMHTTIAVSKRMEQFVKKLGEENDEQTLPVPLGQTLRRFDSYPKAIVDDPFYDLFGNLAQKPEVYDNPYLPHIESLRKSIRETGRLLWFERMHFGVYGIMNGLIVGMDTIKVYNKLRYAI